MATTINVKLKIWRQPGAGAPGKLVDYSADSVNTDMSFLEMLDVVNEKLIASGEEAIAFQSETEERCRDGSQHDSPRGRSQPAVPFNTTRAVRTSSAARDRHDRSAEVPRFDRFPHLIERGLGRSAVAPQRLTSPLIHLVFTHRSHSFTNAASACRSRPRASNSRDLLVPSAMPSDSAISACV